MKLLLVEDDRMFGRAFKAFLTDQGHDVTWLRTVESLDPFLGKDGSGRQVAVVVADYQLALVDGQLEKSAFQGPAVAAQLCAQGLKVLGISSQNGPNEEMVNVGAIAAANKAVAFVGLFCDMMNVEDIVSGAVDAKSCMQQCETEVKANADARHRAEAFLMSVTS